MNKKYYIDIKEDESIAMSLYEIKQFFSVVPDDIEITPDEMEILKDIQNADTIQEIADLNIRLNGGQCSSHTITDIENNITVNC